MSSHVKLVQHLLIRGLGLSWETAVIEYKISLTLEMVNFQHLPLQLTADSHLLTTLRMLIIYSFHSQSL